MRFSDNDTLESLLATIASRKLPAIELSLGRVTALLKALGNPHLNLPPVVHIAGTNGKGSTLAFLQAILNAEGLTVHKYTSPHLVRFNERIQVQSKDIKDNQLIDILDTIRKKLNDHPVTFFEATTVAAFIAFAQSKADLVLLETGMGGRLDATNVIAKPLLTAITPISFDHKEFLGDTIAKIAYEKAGIIKKEVPCIVAKQSDEAAAVFSSVSRTRKAPMIAYGRDWNIESRKGVPYYVSASQEINLSKINLTGTHQVENAVLALACAEHLKGVKISRTSMEKGIQNAHWKARLQRLTTGELVNLLPDQVELWLDGGHNPDAGAALAQWAEREEVPLFVVCGMLGNKDSLEFFEPLAPYVKSLVAIPIPDEPLARPPHQLANLAACAGIESFFAASAAEAIQKVTKRAATIRKPYRILICGSLYLAGHILQKNN